MEVLNLFTKKIAIREVLTMADNKSEIKFEIKQSIGKVSESSKGWAKELNQLE